MSEDLDLELQAWLEEATRKVQGGQQALEEDGENSVDLKEKEE